MTDRALTIGIWMAIVVVVVGVSLLGRAGRLRLLSVGAFADAALAPLVVRLVVFVGWMWLGWHLFAR